MKEASDLLLFPFVMKISRAFSYKAALLRCGGLQEKRKNKKKTKKRKKERKKEKERKKKEKNKAVKSLLRNKGTRHFLFRYQK